MKTTCLISALMVVVQFSGTYCHAQQTPTIKDYLSNPQYYRFANISFFEANKPATERLVREHLPSGIDEDTEIKAFIVTERYKPGTVPNIFGVVLASPMTRTEESDLDHLRTGLGSPIRIFDIHELKAMTTISPKGNGKGSLEGTSHTTMDAYLANDIQQTQMEKRYYLLEYRRKLLYDHYTPHSFSVEYDGRETLQLMAKGAQMPFGFNPEDIRQYTSAYNAKRQKNPLAAFTTIHANLLLEATEVKVCDSALIQEIQRDLTKAGYKQLSGDITLTLLGGDECIRLQYGALELMGKGLVDAVPNTMRTKEKSSRFCVNKVVKIGEVVAANGNIEDVTMMRAGTNYCHQITRLSVMDYAHSMEFSWYDSDVPSESYMYVVDPLNPQPFDYTILTKEYSSSNNDSTNLRRGSIDRDAYTESRGARIGIAMMKEVEYQKAHPNERHKNILPVPPTEPQPFQIAIYANIAKEIGLPETCSLERAFSSIDYNDPRTSIRVYNGNEPDPTSPWVPVATNFGIVAYEFPKKSPPRLIVEKYNPTTNSPFETWTRIQVKNLPPKSPEETRSLRGSVVIQFGYSCTIEGKTEQSMTKITVPINIEYQ